MEDKCQISPLVKYRQNQNTWTLSTFPTSARYIVELTEQKKANSKSQITSLTKTSHSNFCTIVWTLDGVIFLDSAKLVLWLTSLTHSNFFLLVQVTFGRHIYQFCDDNIQDFFTFEIIKLFNFYNEILNNQPKNYPSEIV